MRLLLVEDDVMVASGIKLGLADAGYAVDWVGSGERAQEVLARESFDIGVIDIGLPGIDGLELTRLLRRPEMANPAMPVLILTARDALQDRVQGLDLGADDYMVKPFELPEPAGAAAPFAGRDHGRALLWPAGTRQREPPRQHRRRRRRCRHGH
jgi:DNA-binding response OmpR family regulator